MHEWYTEKSKNIQSLIDVFIDFEFDTDYIDNGRCKTSGVKITTKVFSSEEDARTYITNSSYGGSTAYLAAYTTKKLSKAYQNAFDNFITKHNEYLKFEKNLTIAYGRKSSKATCPSCNSSINLRYGSRFKECPVCGSPKIISDSNWKMLETKERISRKAAEQLKTQAEKNDVTFICGIEWHC